MGLKLVAWIGSEEERFKSPSLTVGLKLKRLIPAGDKPGTSPSLTVGLKLQTYTQRKARNIKHFLRVAPLSSEGSLPKVSGPTRLSVVLSNFNP